MQFQGNGMMAHESLEPGHHNGSVRMQTGPLSVSTATRAGQRVTSMQPSSYLATGALGTKFSIGL